MTDETCLIDDFGPLSVVRPASVAELGDIVRRAAVDAQALYLLGGRTMLGCGAPPTRPGIAVDLRGLDHVIDYPARDMTITVQAGIPVARLQELLAAENQRLPIDVPQPERATLGGSLATNVSGPRRCGFGTLRDYVIGISVVNDEGQEAKAGGRVVKNVAGYDLCKLYIGSLGTLGIITQVTLKVRPRPEEQALLVLPCAADDVGTLLDRLHGTHTRPVCLDLLNAAAAQYIEGCGAGAMPAADPQSRWVIIVGYEDNRTAVNWQMQQLIRELQGVFPLSARVNAAAVPLWRGLAEFAARPDTVLTFKANLLPSAVASFCLDAARLPGALLLQAHAANGIVVGHVTGELTPERARSLLVELRRLATPSQGQVIVLRCPPAWKQTVSVWGPPRGDVGLMRAVKERFDPRRLFNPGRFVDGI